MSKKTIRIVVEGGCVQEVKNLPKGLLYIVEDHDEPEGDLCDICRRSGVEIELTTSAGLTVCTECAEGFEE